MAKGTGSEQVKFHQTIQDAEDMSDHMKYKLFEHKPVKISAH